MNELPISFHRKKIPIFAFIISQMRRLNDEWQFPTHWFWPLVNGDNHAYGEPASSPPVGHPATPHHHRTCRHLFIWPTWSGHLSTSSCVLCPMQSWPMFYAPSVSHREGPTACTFAMCSTWYMSVFQNTAHTHSECVAVARSLKTRLRTPLRLRGVSRKCLRRTAGGNTYSSPPPMRLVTQARASIFSTRQIHAIWEVHSSLGHWYLREMDPPPLSRHRCILMPQALEDIGSV